MSCIITGSMGCSFVYARSLLNHQTGAINQWACVFNGLICLGIGFLFFSLFSKMPSVVLEAILMGLELKTIRIPELIFTFKNDFKLFFTNIVVILSMLFTRGSNAIFIGLFIYLAMFAKELMIPQNEVTFTHAGQKSRLSKSYLESSSKFKFILSPVANFL
jgi:MFS superfamily sulfate permease-like transporter